MNINKMTIRARAYRILIAGMICLSLVIGNVPAVLAADSPHTGNATKTAADGIIAYAATNAVADSDAEKAVAGRVNVYATTNHAKKFNGGSSLIQRGYYGFNTSYKFVNKGRTLKATNKDVAIDSNIAKIKATSKTIRFSGLSAHWRKETGLKNKTYYYRFARYDNNGMLYLYSNKSGYNKQNITKIIALGYEKKVSNPFYSIWDSVYNKQVRTDGKTELLTTSKCTFNIYYRNVRDQYGDMDLGPLKGKGTVSATKNTVTFTFKTKLLGSIGKIKSGKKYYYRITKSSDYGDEITLYNSKSAYKNKKAYLSMIIGAWD